MYLKLIKSSSFNSSFFSDEQISKPARSKKDQESHTIEHAILSNSHQSIIRLLQKGIKITEEELKTAIYLYCNEPHSVSFTVMQTLVQQSRLKAPEFHARLLRIAIMHKKLRLIQELCNLSIDWQYIGPENEMLLFFALRKFPRIIPLLCNAGADINQRNQNGLTMMHLLAQANYSRSNCINELTMLYELDADPTLKIPDSELTALQWAQLQHKEELADSLKKYAIDFTRKHPFTPVETEQEQTEQLKAILLKLALFSAKKAKSLIPFSSNLPGGSDYKKQILLKLVRTIKTPLTECYSTLELDPSIDMSSTQPFVIKDAQGEAASKTLLQILDEIIELPEFHNQRIRKNGQLISVPELFEKVAKRAIRYRVGNCFELNATAIMCMNELTMPTLPPLSYELFGLIGKKNGDHSFIVLNRAPNSSINDMSTWGEYATICDPWYFESVNVSEQLKLERNQQARTIQHCLHYQKHLFRLHSGTTGEGHSAHWNHKHAHNSGMFFMHKETREQKENISAEPTTCLP